MVNEYVPGAAFLVAEIVSVELPVAVAGFGANAAETLEGNPEILRLTELLAPIAVNVTVTELLDLRFTVTDAGAAIEKSPAAAFTVTDSEVVRVTVPSLP